MTQTERSAYRYSKMTSVGKSAAPVTTEGNDGGRIDTVGDSVQDTSRIEHQILNVRRMATSFVTERTDQTYKKAHKRWLDEKRVLFDTLKKQ
jgi:hypothetical protein